MSFKSSVTRMLSWQSNEEPVFPGTTTRSPSTVAWEEIRFTYSDRKKTGVTIDERPAVHRVERMLLWHR